MEIPNTLLVALMFVTIITLGLASILTDLAELIRGAKRREIDRLQVGWALLLLFIHFSLFWHAADVSILKEWRFDLFLLAVSGPVILFLATQVVLTVERAPTDSQVGLVEGRFFIMLGALQAWGIAVDFMLGRGFTVIGVINIILLVLLIGLSTTTQRKPHVIGETLVWLLFLGSLGLEGAGIGV